MSKNRSKLTTVKNNAPIASIFAGIAVRTAASAIGGTSVAAVTAVGFPAFVGGAAIVGLAAWGVLNIVEAIIE